MSLQSERLLNHTLRLRLMHLPNCFHAIVEEASAKDLPTCRTWTSLSRHLKPTAIPSIRGTSSSRSSGRIFPTTKGPNQFSSTFQPSIHERELREVTSLAFLERKENVPVIGSPGIGKTPSAPKPSLVRPFTSSPYRIWTHSFSHQRGITSMQPPRVANSTSRQSTPNIVNRSEAHWR